MLTAVYCSEMGAEMHVSTFAAELPQYLLWAPAESIRVNPPHKGQV
jgi:hypothetical protein